MGKQDYAKAIESLEKAKEREPETHIHHDYSWGSLRHDWRYGRGYKRVGRSHLHKASDDLYATYNLGGFLPKG